MSQVLEPSQIELQQLNAQNDTHAREGHSLPPTDGGSKAWLFLFASFLIETFLWGTSTINEYSYRTHYF